MSVTEKYGFECKAYRNSGSYGSPTWVEVKNVRDLTLGLESTEVDLSTRGDGGIEVVGQGLHKRQVEFEMVWDTADTNFTAIQNAHFGRTNIEMLFLDGPEETTGSQGLRASMKVLKFTREEKLDGAVVAKVTMKPGRSDNPPAWYTAS